MTAGPVSRILSGILRCLDGHSSRRRVTATLRFSDLPGGLTRRASTSSPCGDVPPYLVLLRVGFTMPRPLLGGRCALTAPFHPYPVSGAVCFLWHWPSAGLEPGVPDVIRHTALQSSDFPRVATRPSDPAANSSIIGDAYRRCGFDFPCPASGVRPSRYRKGTPPAN